MKRFPWLLLAGLLIAILLCGCSPVGNRRDTAATASEKTTPAMFSSLKCWFEVPAGVAVDCGYVKVPEDRSQPFTASNTIQLAVAIFRSRAAHPAPDPIVYHVGGPGGHMQMITANLFERVIAPFLASRDFVLIDPRGTGNSRPALECINGEEVADCLRRLFSEGHHLYAYNSRNMAADLQDLRRALEYDRWNLLGESYGTHVAQVVMGEQSEGLRSVILDAVAPIVLPELPGNATSFDVALGRLSTRCRDDFACQAAYGDLESAFAAAVERLDREPVQLNVDFDGETRSITMDGGKMMDYTMAALYEVDLIPYLPFAIHSTANGSSYDFWQYTARWEHHIEKILSRGAHWAVLCGDGRVGPCENWPVVIEKKPVASDIPTLVFSGEFDPVTPPEYGQAVAESLSNSYVFVFPGFGHWTNGTGHPCQSAIIQAFLANPSQPPDASCIGDIQVHFMLPEEINDALK